MSWNGSTKSLKASSDNTKRLSGHGIIVLVSVLLVTAVAGILMYSLQGVKEKNKPDPNAVDQHQIVEAKPEILPSPQKTAVTPEPLDPNARPTKVGEVVNGYVLLPSGRLHKRQGVITNSPATRLKAKYAIFSRSCNNEIAAYLSIKPGDTLLGSRRYNGRFKQDFLDSIKEPILISADDSPETAQLKHDVIEARLVLKDAYDRGEDIEQIMLETRQQLQDLGLYKRQLRKEFNQLRREEGVTDSDVQDIYDACNKLLESKGIEPMNFSPITKQVLLRDYTNNDDE